MIDFKLKYQAVIFVNNEDIIPTPKVIQKLMADVFLDYELIPNTFHEISNLNPQPTPRLRFSSTNNEWNISFGSTRIDIEKLPTDATGQSLGELKSFCQSVIKILEKLFAVFPKKTNRVSLVAEYFFKEMNEDELYSVYTKLFTPPKILIENKPTEWNFRSVVKVSKEFNEKKEDINFIATINRVSGSFMNLGSLTATNFVDKLQLSIDINTSQHNKEYRFDIKDIKEYYSNVYVWCEDFTEQITSHIK